MNATVPPEVWPTAKGPAPSNAFLNRTALGSRPASLHAPRRYDRSVSSSTRPITETPTTAVPCRRPNDIEIANLSGCADPRWCKDPETHIRQITPLFTLPDLWVRTGEIRSVSTVRTAKPAAHPSPKDLIQVISVHITGLSAVHTGPSSMTDAPDLQQSAVESQPRS